MIMRRNFVLGLLGIQRASPSSYQHLHVTIYGDITANDQKATASTLSRSKKYGSVPHTVAKVFKLTLAVIYATSSDDSETKARHHQRGSRPSQPLLYVPPITGFLTCNNNSPSSSISMATPTSCPSNKSGKNKQTALQSSKMQMHDDRTKRKDS
jgi:hypothetical protein